MKNRENFYRFLSRLFEKEVSASLLETLRHMTIPAAGTLAEGAGMMTAFLAAPAADPADMLAADYAGTFLGAGKSDGSCAYPYESVYTSKEHLVMQEAWAEVKSIYESRNLVLTSDMSDIKEDHIAAELKFMSLLSAKAVSDPSLLTDQIDFLKEHLTNWCGKFLEDTEKYAETGFYKGLSKLTSAFLTADLETLENLRLYDQTPVLSYTLNSGETDCLLKALGETYDIYAPKLLPKRGPKGKDLVRYQQISSAAEIVYDRPSDFSAKEVYYPVSQTLFYFTDTACEESALKSDRNLLIFMHPCDINAMQRLDNIFLKNGGREDSYYRRLREKVRIVLLECNHSDDSCFCVSMGSNTTDQYDLAVRFTGGGALFQVKDPAFAEYFKDAAAADFEPAFIMSNLKKANLPVIENADTLKLAAKLDYWNTFDEKCISCGGCNTVCPSCSCFDTIDITYNETSRDGERRRVWSSCMLDTFTMTAGGNRARKTPGANMRFKTLHKVYDYRRRFGTAENMCVGCGRCIRQCPEGISFLDTINGFHDALEAAKGGMKHE